MLSLFVISTTVNHLGSAFISANLQAMVIQNTYYYYYGISYSVHPVLWYSFPLFEHHFVVPLIMYCRNTWSDIQTSSLNTHSSEKSSLPLLPNCISCKSLTDKELFEQALIDNDSFVELEATGNQILYLFVKIF